jgi:hypothetical protein
MLIEIMKIRNPQNFEYYKSSMFHKDINIMGLMVLV